MKAEPVQEFEARLRGHLQHRTVLIDPEIDEVLLDVCRFTSATVDSGFRKALKQLLSDSDIPPDRPFVQVCDAIVECHLRGIKETHRDLVSKSLFEAYLYVGGTQYAFDRPGKTLFVRTLRRGGVKRFAELFLSLHLFNVVSLEINEKVSAAMRDLRSFEIYMLSVEAVCRDIVTRAMRSGDLELDERWAATVRRNIESQLLFP